MDKPITIQIDEFKAKIADVINNSNLHTFVILQIMKEFTNEVSMIYEQQHQADIKTYNESLQTKTETEE